MFLGSLQIGCFYDSCNISISETDCAQEQYCLFQYTNIAIKQNRSWNNRVICASTCLTQDTVGIGLEIKR